MNLLLISLLTSPILLPWPTAAQPEKAARPKGSAPAVQDIARTLAGKLTDEQAVAVLRSLKRRYPPNTDFKTGRQRPLAEKNTVLWLLEAPPAAEVRVVTSDQKSWPLEPLGTTGFHAKAVTLPNVYETQYHFEVGGQRRGGGTLRVEFFPLGPDSLPQAGVPAGKLIQQPAWKSRIYPGTVRDWWIYVPAQYDPNGAGAAVMVFQDGQGYAKGDGNACTVFDNLIQQRKMPVTIGVFVNPGVFADPPPRPGQRPRSNRSNEYDTCTPTYAEFLEKEILAEVAKEYKLKPGPQDHAICGASSGGSCAFTAAWYRPDLFGRVLSHVGSFCDFRQVKDYPALDGTQPPRRDDPATWKVAHNYPGFIRKTRPIKPLRVFLQDGTHDLNNEHGDWPLANQQMAKALEFAGYKYRFVVGDGFHSLNHGRAILPASLIWLWQDD